MYVTRVCCQVQNAAAEHRAFSFHGVGRKKINEADVHVDFCLKHPGIKTLRKLKVQKIKILLKTPPGIPGWRSGLAPACGPGRDPGDPGSNPTSGSRCREPAFPLPMSLPLSRVSRIAPWAKGRSQTAVPPRDPLFLPSRGPSRLFCTVAAPLFMYS